MTQYTFRDPCPHCGHELRVDTIAVLNVEEYRQPRLVKAECCGRGVYVQPVTTFIARPSYGCDSTDDWGRELKPSTVDDKAGALLPQYIAYRAARREALKIVLSVPLWTRATMQGYAPQAMIDEVAEALARMVDVYDAIDKHV